MHYLTFPELYLSSLVKILSNNELLKGMWCRKQMVFNWEE